MSQPLFNTHIANSQVLLTPAEIKAKLPLTDRAEDNIYQFRHQIEDILDRKDSRCFVVVGPCSIHDVEAAREYARRLKELADRVRDRLFLVMRVYFEKPRTTVGWKGLINDPDMDDSFHIEKGLLQARHLLVDLAELGLPAATEALDPIVPQYLSDVLSWSAIGARTIESQTHREMASGLSMPVGLKNGTNGSIEVALNAMKAAREPHSFLGIDELGRVSVFNTSGNNYAHIILRGGGGQTNFDAESIRQVEAQLKAANLPPQIVVDCSHGNSNKDHKRQAAVFEDVVRQVCQGNSSIVGMMLESNLHEGNQKIPQDLKDLQYGVSVTDKCLGWEETEQSILNAYQTLSCRPVSVG
ncbi:MAG: 3-deoxy-7-phosphoheptulonate synthase [Cyanobacteria bacterium SID2]|nr:3-deoxy-7-phosphoheptulonate synthase [Cyanobacteria bacterium SID2]MBP0006610.1 3-deoxy-7-phosphoheptulonate synthase [Cyanobacteria bacterium SBC]